MKQFIKAETVNKFQKYNPSISIAKAFIGSGLIFSQGDVWKSKRKLLSQCFNFELLKANIPRIVDICDEFMSRFQLNHRKTSRIFAYDAMHITQQIYNKILMRCFFGCDDVDIKVNGKGFEDALTDIISRAAALSLNKFMVFCGKYAYKIGLTKKIREIKNDIGTFRELLQEIMKKRIAEIDQEKNQAICSDLIQAIIYQKRKDKEHFNYTDSDLIDEFTTFLAVGTDTTSKLATMMLYYIGKYPTIQKKLREQVNGIIKSNADITNENLKRLTYIDQIQNESLRHYGPVNGIFLRQAKEDLLVADIPILKGTTVMLQQRGSHYNPKYFKDPEEFRPERWENECDNIHPYAFLGFSAGPRSCIGKQLALLQSKITIVKMIKRYAEIESPKDPLTFTFRLIYEPDPFQITFKKAQDKSPQ